MPPDHEQYMPIIYESILMSHYGGMSLDEIRDLDYADFEAHLQVCLARELGNREFDMNVHGIPTGETAQKTTSSPIRVKKGGGPVKQVVSERIRLTKPLTEEDLL